MDTGGRDHYPDYSSPSSGPSSTPSARGGGAGGSGGEPDPCSVAIEASLEEVAISEYWAERRTVPAVGTEAVLLDALVSGRLAVACEGMIVGYLPVRFNYVYRVCLPAGITYVGEVIESEGGAIPLVTVDLQPQ